MAGRRICPITVIINTPRRWRSSVLSRLKPNFATFVPLFTTRDKSVLAPPTQLPQLSNSIAKSKSSPTSSRHDSSFTTTSGTWNTACHSTTARKFATALRVLATKALAQKKNGLTTTLRLAGRSVVVRPFFFWASALVANTLNAVANLRAVVEWHAVFHVPLVVVNEES